MVNKISDWVPNKMEAASGVEYVFIKLPVIQFCIKTSPSGVNSAKIEWNKSWLKTEPETWMPIIHFNQYKDRMNCLVFEQGRHRTIAAASFSNVKPEITIMVEKNRLEQVVEVLDCEIIKTVSNPFPNYPGDLYELKVIG